MEVGGSEMMVLRISVPRAGRDGRGESAGFKVSRAVMKVLRAVIAESCCRGPSLAISLSSGGVLV